MMKEKGVAEHMKICWQRMTMWIGRLAVAKQVRDSGDTQPIKDWANIFAYWTVEQAVQDAHRLLDQR
eukprot:7242045-Prorocentrum_lima.AAC.1